MEKARFQGQADPRLLAAELGRLPSMKGTDMQNTIDIAMDIHGESLNKLIGFKRIVAHGGVYVKDGPWAPKWSFILDPAIKRKIDIAAIAASDAGRSFPAAPVAIPVNKLVCWNTIPSHPLIGGFTHPTYGFHCRAADIPLAWDTAIHGTPRVQLTADSGGMSGVSAVSVAVQRKANMRAAEFSKALGVGTSKQPTWWVYTLPKVENGKPIVEVGAASDKTTLAKVTTLFPRRSDVAFRAEMLQPTASLDTDDMGDAPIDIVWPTDEGYYHEPIGPGTGDDDPAMGEMQSCFPCAKCGAMRPTNSTPCPRCGVSAGWAKCGGGPCRPQDTGMGYAPVVAMPTGMLNFDRPNPYEGQNWTIKDPPEWAHPTGMSGESGGSPTGLTPTVKLGLLSAVVGGAAGFVMAPSGADPKRTAALAALGFGAAGAAIGRLLTAAQDMLTNRVQG